MTKLAIVGSRSFNNYELAEQLIHQIIDKHHLKLSDITIVSGGAKGADKIAEDFAKKYSFETIIFKPDWVRYGKSAGMIRNKDIISNADIVIAFWDGSSKGTKNSINHAKKMKKICYVVKFAINKDDNFNDIYSYDIELHQYADLTKRTSRSLIDIRTKIR